MDQIEGLPFTAVREFVSRQRVAGRYNSATARNLAAACAHVEPLLEAGANTVGYVSHNLDDILERYRNLNGHVGQASINTYRARIKRAVADFIGHRTDPQWRPVSRPKRETDERSPEASRTPSPKVQSLQVQVESPGGLRHRLPLRPDFDVEIVLPRDLTGKEARRLVAWISTLAQDDDLDGRTA
jgi:hypothetical protein